MEPAEAEESVQPVEIVARVAAIDIAKASGMVCLRLPHPSRADRRTQQVWNVGATTGEITALAERLVQGGVERVVMEATSVYWKPFFYLLEAAGLECWLVNARDVKNVPGRAKTDKLDAVWLAKLTERGMLRPSFVPPKPVRQLRDLTRARAVLTEDRTRIRQRAEKLLEDAQIKLSSAVSELFGATGRRMMAALVDGQRDPYHLADLADRRIKAPRQVLVEALRGQFEEHHAFLLRTYLDTEAHLSAQIDALTARIEAILADTPAYRDDPGDGAGAGQSLAALAARLDEVPGIGPGTAQMLLAELGWDMSVFPSPDHLASWAKLAPRTIQSGGRQANGATGKGNRYLKGTLGEAAMAAANTKNSFFHARYQRIVKHRGKKKALVAVARSLLQVIWHLINNPEARYQDLGHDWHDRINPERRTLNLVAQLRALGHDVALSPREDLTAQAA